MRPGAPMGSPSLGHPRRLGALSEVALFSATHPAPIASTSTFPSTTGDDGGDESEVMIYTLDEADDEDQGLEDEFDEEDEEDEDSEEEEEQDDGGDDDDDDDESIRYGGHLNCPIHHHPLHPVPNLPIYYQDLNGYLSDDLDMSDDAGAPLVDYLVANLLTNEMGVDGSSESGSDHDFSSTEDDGSNPESAILDDAMLAHVQSSEQIDAAFASMVPLGLVPPAVPNPPALPPLFDQFNPEAGTQTINPWFEGNHPLPFPNPMPTIGPSNYGLTDFLHHWARQSRILQGLARGRCPWPARVNLLESSELARVQYQDLEGDQCDFQGVDWGDIGVTREDARERRLLTYNNYVNVPMSDRWTVSPTRDSASLIPKADRATAEPPSTQRKLLPLPVHGLQTQHPPVALPAPQRAREHLTLTGILPRHWCRASIQPHVREWPCSHEAQ